MDLHGGHCPQPFTCFFVHVAICQHRGGYVRGVRSIKVCVVGFHGSLFEENSYLRAVIR